MEKDRIVYPFIKEYFRKIRRPRGGILGDIEREARASSYPISDEETADLLDIICRLKRPSKVLEIGTCIAFSSLLMAEACPGVHIDTVERNPVMIRPAKVNIAKFPQHDINLIEGDALSVLPGLNGAYDLVYIDAAKGQYPNFLPLCKKLMESNSILISDNVLFNGYVADGKPDVRRNKTIVTRLDEYLRMLENDNDFNTVLLPISDGVTLSYKLN